MDLNMALLWHLRPVEPAGVQYFLGSMIRQEILPTLECTAQWMPESGIQPGIQFIVMALDQTLDGLEADGHHGCADFGGYGS